MQARLIVCSRYHFPSVLQKRSRLVRGRGVLSDGAPCGAPGTTAQRRAIVALGNTVKRQALVLGYSDTFMVLGMVLLLSAAAILLTKGSKSGAAPGGAH
jgi:hypothetical protein